MKENNDDEKEIDLEHHLHHDCKKEDVKRSFNGTDGQQGSQDEFGPNGPKNLLRLCADRIITTSTSMFKINCNDPSRSYLFNG